MMTFEEKLERARGGSRAAYGAACLGSLDALFSAALMALKSEKAARTAVITAIDDGFSGISRIKDERHLRSWLAHEITKYAVDKLREYKAGGTSEAPAAAFAETAALSDVERLVFAISAAFGYNPREISVLTGMSESSVSEKLSSAKSRLGGSYEKMRRAAADMTAPETLRDKYAAYDTADEQPLQIKILYPDMSEKPETASSEPVKEELPEPPQAKPEETLPPEPVKEEAPAKHLPPKDETKHGLYMENEPAGKLSVSDTIQFGFKTVNDDEAVFTDETEEETYTEDEADGDYDDSDDNSLVFAEEEPAEMPLNAETFIAVVSAEKMKGSEFLRLIGNTRISNSAYREIEQNPRLTKKRLIELLDSSHLTENDYYKLLTALKERHDVLDAKEESRLTLERAGLYDGSRRGKYKRRRREKPKTELQMAIGITGEKKEGPLILSSGPMDDDETDYQLLNSGGTFSHPGYYSDRKMIGTDPDENELRKAVIVPKNENYKDDPMSHKALHDLFDESSERAVDPFAAIAANEADEQARPERIEQQKSRESAAEFDEASAAMSDENSDGTLEFDIAVGATAEIDLKTTDGSEQKARPSAPYTPTVYDDDLYSVKDETPEVSIESVRPTGDVSVTQIIRDFASGEEVSDAAAEQAAGISSVPETEKKRPAPEKSEDNTHPVGFTPDVGLMFDDDDDDNAPSSGMTAELPYFPDEKEIKALGLKSEERSASAHHDNEYDHFSAFNEPEEYEEVEELPEDEALPTDDEMPFVPDEEPGEDGSFDTVPDRKRYKGNEYFIDDNEYYEGVNNGKIAACAIFAVLLTAGGIGMGFIPKAEALPAETVINNEITETSETVETALPPVVEEEFVSEPTFAKLGSYAEMTDEKYEGADIDAPISANDYLRASAEPFPTDIITEFSGGGIVFAGDTAFVYSRESGDFRAVYLGESDDTETEATVEEEEITAPNVQEAYLDAFTVINDELYVISANGTNTEETVISVYDKKLSKTGEFTLSGSYAGCGIIDGKLAAAACFDPNKASDLKNSGSYVSEHPYYISGGELKEIPASDIFAIDGAKHNAVHIFYYVGGNDAHAVIGGCRGAYSGDSVKFSDDNISLVVSDGDASYAADIGSDLKINKVTAFKGSAVGADCVGQGGMIGMYKNGEEYGISAYKGGKSLTVPDVSVMSAAWSENGTAYVVAEQNGGGMMLYGFGMSGETPESADISASDIYTEKLIKSGEYLAGLKAEPTPDGERAGLRLSLYEYDGALKEVAYSIIELDKDTPRENLKYLSSPAEQNILTLGTNEDGTLFAVPTVYFDGYSEVERVVLLSFNGTIFSQVAEYISYDEKSSVLIPVIRDGKVFIITDTKVTAKEIEE